MNLTKIGLPKLKARNVASRQNILHFDFWREASLRAFSLATPHFSEIQVKNILVSYHLRIKGSDSGNSFIAFDRFLQII